MAVSHHLTWLVLAIVYTALAARYPDEHLPEGKQQFTLQQLKLFTAGNRTVIGIAHTKYAIQAFALGKDNKLWHRYLLAGSQTWSGWVQRPSPPIGDLDGDPVVAANRDGRVEVFIRQAVNLDLWQFYQTDASNPLAWTVARESSCTDTPAICKNTTLTYWNTQPAFPTSDVSIVPDPQDGRLQVFYRGFDGALYRCRQKTPGDPSSYSPPERFDVILE